MTYKFVDRAQMSVSGAPGTGPISLGSALFGYQSLYGPNGLSNGDTFRMLAVDPSGAWEIGIGTYASAGNVVTRNPTMTSAPGNGPVTLSSNAVIGCTFAAEDISTGSLSGLVDVDVTESAGIDGYVLTFNNGSGKWEAEAPTTGSSLAGLSDVSLTSPSNHQALLYVTADNDWENVSLASVALSGAYSALTGAPTIPTNASFDLSSLGDVVITTVADDDVVTWDSGISKWINKAGGGGGGGSGTVTTVKDNGSNVDTAAVSLNFINATSITTSGHAVTITLPTGGGGGGGAGTVGTPPTFVQFGDASTSSGSGSPPAVVFGSGPGNGNMLIAITWQDGNAAPTAASGWTLKDTQGDGAFWIQIYTKICGASESTSQTPAQGGNGAHWTIGMWEVSGQNASPDVSYMTNYSSQNTRTIATPGLSQSSGTFFCASIASNTATDTLSKVYGTATIDANLSSANIAAAFGHSDSNYSAYGLMAEQSGFVPGCWAFAIVKS